MPCQQRKHRREREDTSSFRALVATPGNLATGVLLPAQAQLYVSRSVATAAATAVLEVRAPGGTLKRTLSYGVNGANVPRWIAFVEEDLRVVKVTGLPGTLRLFIRNGVGRLLRIAEG